MPRGKKSTTAVEDANAVDYRYPHEKRTNIPPGLIAGKTKVSVRFQASGNGRIAPVFGVRMIRAKEA